ncbi:proliferating cell nuclear antigen (pcna) [Candidatus Woesearchaeota archaeon]|nr:proliferating cell nuclear antigen (pcna) [Candidatus Woesearchaeota archaeon]
MKLALAEPRYLKDPIAIISELVNEVRLKIDKDKIEIIAMDPANVAMVIFRLLNTVFLDYDVKNKQEIAVNLEHLKNVLKRAKPSDTLIVELDEARNKLRIQLKGESTRTFNLAILDTEEREQQIPNLKFPVKVEMNSMMFDEAIEDMDIIAESVNLIADQKKLTIHAEGTVSDARVEINHKEDEANIDLQGSEIKSKYSIEYLKKIIKGSKLADKVILQFSKDYPLKVDYVVRDKLSLSTILAPRVDSD